MLCLLSQKNPFSQALVLCAKAGTDLKLTPIPQLPGHNCRGDGGTALHIAGGECTDPSLSVEGRVSFLFDFSVEMAILN